MITEIKGCDLPLEANMYRDECCWCRFWKKGIFKNSCKIDQIGCPAYKAEISRKTDLFVVLKVTRPDGICKTVLKHAYSCLEDAQNAIVNGAEKRGLIINKIDENTFVDDVYMYHIFKLQIV